MEQLVYSEGIRVKVGGIWYRAREVWYEFGMGDSGTMVGYLGGYVNWGYGGKVVEEVEVKKLGSWVSVFDLCGDDGAFIVKEAEVGDLLGVSKGLGLFKKRGVRGGVWEWEELKGGGMPIDLDVVRVDTLEGFLRLISYVDWYYVIRVIDLRGYKGDIDWVLGYLKKRKRLCLDVIKPGYEVEEIMGGDIVVRELEILKRSSEVEV